MTYGGVNAPVDLPFFPWQDVIVREHTSVRLIAHDLDAHDARCRAADVVHPNGPSKAKPWGTREFSVVDLFGVLVTLHSPIRQADNKKALLSAGRRRRSASAVLTR